jgi:uncharacterized RDD family membrane protein YckC
MSSVIDDSGASAAAGSPVASLWQRLMSALYECVLLFGVLFLALLVYFRVTNMQTLRVPASHPGLTTYTFLVLAVYFMGFWLKNGQTLAMKTWHIKVMRVDGLPLRPQQALVRYLAAWLWVAPPFLVLTASGLTSVAAHVTVVLLWVTGYTMLSTRHPRRQFLHDAFAGTELVSTRHSAEAAAGKQR